MIERDIFLIACRNQIGKPYQYGSNGPDSFDCSGLMLYALRQCPTFNKMPDTSAMGLFRTFLSFSVPVIKGFKNIQPGMLFFYGDVLANISHVMAVNSVWAPGKFTLIGARGGDSRTKTLDAAYNTTGRFACVDIQRGDYWLNNLQAIVDPFNGK